ncbi:hypothetical protein [Nitrosomonas marina]|uniref:Uncharacterized protein n=1 Tax=Nitrosomonas marina TaxID=917 RepID=A0A1H8FWW4_9PROT|nr:hypothetical protein [Nitrosomonas marina]SEN36139.1 hypothetical protein SAMN05216325_11521 [Nitrosomonas marina]
MPIFLHYAATSKVLDKLKNSEDEQITEVKPESEEKTPVIKIQPTKPEEKPIQAGLLLHALVSRDYDWNRIAACVFSEVN